MGRASRRKKERRERLCQPTKMEEPYPNRSGFDKVYPYSSRAKKQADRAEQYGRTVSSRLLDYEAAAERGQDSLAATLISRHNQRMERVGRVQPALIKRSRILMNQLFANDLGLRKAGADPERAPVEYGGAWVEHVAWGADSIVAAVRLLLSGCCYQASF